MGLTCQLHFSSNSHNYIWEKYYYFSHITVGKIEVQRGLELVQGHTARRW